MKTILTRFPNDPAFINTYDVFYPVVKMREGFCEPEPIQPPQKENSTNHPQLEGKSQTTYTRRRMSELQIANDPYFTLLLCMIVINLVLIAGFVVMLRELRKRAKEIPHPL